MNQKMEAAIISFRAYEADFKLQVKKFVQDKSIPLDERWEVFMEAKVGGRNDYGCSEVLDDDIFCYGHDYLYYEPGCTITADELWDALTEEHTQKKILKDFPDVDFDAFREEMLANFVWEFYYDY
jgi:hypothetical protein